MITIILVEPKTAGNIGAIARNMGNFDFSKLIVINPKCDILSKEAMDRASHAKKILENADIVNNLELLKDFDTVIGTTAKMGSDYNITRSPINVREFDFSKIKNKKCAIVFGREDQGLLNEELQLCDFILTIPTSKKYGSVNLSHAVNIILYEAAKDIDNITNHISKPIKEEKEILDNSIKEAIKKLEFTTEYKRNTAYKVLKKVIFKAIPSKRELTSLIGFFKKIK